MIFVAIHVPTDVLYDGTSLRRPNVALHHRWCGVDLHLRRRIFVSFVRIYSRDL